MPPSSSLFSGLSSGLCNWLLDESEEDDGTESSALESSTSHPSRTSCLLQDEPGVPVPSVEVGFPVPSVEVVPSVQVVETVAQAVDLEAEVVVVALVSLLAPAAV